MEVDSFIFTTFSITLSIGLLIKYVEACLHTVYFHVYFRYLTYALRISIFPQ